MRIFTAELKRFLKTRSVQITLLLGLLFAVALAYFPISFESYTYTDEDGQEVTVEGLEAIRMQRENQGQFHGEITEEKLAESIDRWHSFENRYEGGLPDGIYDDRVSGSDYFQDVYPYEWILTRMSEAYAEPETGMALSREELTEEHADGFYQQIDRHLSDLLYLENGTGKKVDAAVSQAKTLYEQIDRPFYYESGISSNAVDYTVLIVFLLVILGTILAAPAFSGDYQTQAEQIIKCTKYGRRKLAVNRMLAGLLIMTVEYFLCISIFLLITDTAFGWESLKTSVQALLSVAVFLPVNIWELQILIALGGYISLLATICFTMFLSGRMKKIFSSSILALVFLFLPLLLYIMANGNVGNWLRCLLPSSGVGLNNSLTYALLDTKFVFAGDMAVWIPFVMVGAAAVEAVVFFFFAVRDWCRRSKG